jgi:pimeloyl-ACP methyl ester carboxylesterase
MTYREQEIQASGLVCVPVSQGNSFPVMSFQHGTIVAKSEAPSLSYNSIQNIMVAGIAGAGYVLIVPDLIGFGASESFFHPYLVKESNVNAVVAMLDAVNELPQGSLNGSSINDSLFLAGYSQGGWAAMGVLENLENSNSKWNVIATACGAGPYNPELVLDYVLENDTYLKPFFLPYVLLSFIEDRTIYGDMSKYFNEPYASKIPTLYDGINTGSQIDVELSTNTTVLIASGLYSYKTDTNYAEVLDSFEKNRVYAWETDAPILLMHGANDVYIPPVLSESIFSDFQAAGATQVSYVSIPQADHNTAAAPAIGLALNFFKQYRSPGLLAKK